MPEPVRVALVGLPHRRRRIRTWLLAATALASLVTAGLPPAQADESSALVPFAAPSRPGSRPFLPPGGADAGTRTPISRGTEPAATPRSSPGTTLGGTVVTLGCLAAVLLLAGSWARRRQAMSLSAGPRGAVEVLDVTRLSGPLAIHLVQVGDRILVLGSGTDGLRTLAEITDPAEQAHVVHLCRAASRASGAILSPGPWWPLVSGLWSGGARRESAGATPHDELQSVTSDGRHPAPRQPTARPTIASTQAARTVRVGIGWLCVSLAALTAEAQDVGRTAAPFAAPGVTSSTDTANRTSTGAAALLPQSGNDRAPGTREAHQLQPQHPIWTGTSPPVQPLPVWNGPAQAETVTRSPPDGPVQVHAGRPLTSPQGESGTAAVPVAPPGREPAAYQLLTDVRSPSPARSAATAPSTMSAAPAEEGSTPYVATSPLAMLPLDSLGGTLRMVLLVGVLSLAPAILLMTTCYVRVMIVLGLLRQALGSPQFPPTQVLTALALFLTALVMWPVWQTAYREGIEPYSQSERTELGPAGRAAAWEAAAHATIRPVREFMSRQIDATGNVATVDLLWEYHASEPSAASEAPQFYEDVPLQVLLPAYILSELKTAFLIGVQLYLPFVVLDLLTASVLAAVGLPLVSPASVALPLKLLLFVLVDGWSLTVDLLLQSLPR